MADQGIASGSNVVLALLVARSSKPAEFGAYSLAFAAYALCVGLSRAVGANTFVLRYATADRAEQRRHYRALTGIGLLISLAGVVVMVLASLSGGPITAFFVPFAILLPGLVVQDDWRQAMFAARDPRNAFLCDLVWLVVELPLFAVASRVSGTPQAYVVVWGLAAWFATASFCLRYRTLPSPSRALRFVRNNRSLMPGLVGEYVATAGGGLLLPYGIAGVLGLGAAGALRAGQIVYGIAATALMGLVPVVMTYCVRAYEIGGARALRRMQYIFLILGCGWMTIFAVVVESFPASVGRALAGKSWSGASSILAALAVVYVAQWASTVNLSALRATANVRRTALVRAVMTVLLLGGSTAAAAAAGLRGAAWGMACAAAVGAALSGIALLRIDEPAAIGVAADPGSDRGTMRQ